MLTDKMLKVGWKLVQGQARILTCTNPCYSTTVPEHEKIASSVQDENLIEIPPKKSSKRIVHQNHRFMKSQMPNNGNQDLKRFLHEVGTDAKEARYWLKNFQRISENRGPFAIIQIESEVFNEKNLNSLASSIAFLHRHEMPCIVIHGCPLVDNGNNLTKSDFLKIRRHLQNQCRVLVGALESHGAHARPFFGGSGILNAAQSNDNNFKGDLRSVNTELLQWTLQSTYVPILPVLGETSSGQIVSLDLPQVTSMVSKKLQPLKVLMLNNSGGLTNKRGEVIPNISLPDDLDLAANPDWCSDKTKDQMELIMDLLQSLREESSVVITSASKMVNELFSHKGTGTMFKIPERIVTFRDLDDLDLGKLLTLLNRSFMKPLKKDYFDNLNGRLHTAYISEKYNAAAILTQEEGMNVPYLDKFAVSLSKQSEGMADVLMKAIKRDFNQFFWRSRRSNHKINHWYFKQCEGVQARGDWYAFWYGVHDHGLSSELINYITTQPDSFDRAESRN